LLDFQKILKTGTIAGFSGNPEHPAMAPLSVSCKQVPSLDFRKILKISTIAGFSENPENQHHRWIFRKF